MAFVFAGLTTIAFPWFFAWKFPFKLGAIYPMLKVYAAYGFYIWVGIVGLSAMLTYQAWYHLNIAYGTVFLPLTLEAAVRLRRGPTIGRGVILGGS